ncbi:MAG TPA: hypothetical protein VFY05_00760, partial [Candidatus Angelobacter sp.]|nr:hypothetical protein [Candidatus Angelobacter sp.]
MSRLAITLMLGAGVNLFSGCGGSSLATPPKATKFTVTGPASIQTGSPASITVMATDDLGNTVSSYGGSVVISSSDGLAVLPPASTLTNGAGIFTVTFHTSGSQTITARDSASAAITGTSGPVNVTSAPAPPTATKFKVSAPASATSGTAISVTVTATDDLGNTATSYAGIVKFSSSDPSASLPAPSTLTNGVGVFSSTLRTNGTQTIAATDSVSAAIAGASGLISVTGASAPAISSLSPSSVTAGAAAFVLTVNGSNFVSGATVQWNASNRTTTFINGGHLTAAITAA